MHRYCSILKKCFHLFNAIHNHLTSGQPPVLLFWKFTLLRQSQPTVRQTTFPPFLDCSPSSALKTCCELEGPPNLQQVENWSLCSSTGSVILSRQGICFRMTHISTYISVRNTEPGPHLCHILTWEWLWDDLVFHNNVRDLGFDLNCLPGQLGEDLLTEQNILSRLQFHVPLLRTWAETKEKTKSFVCGIYSYNLEWAQSSFAKA